MKLLKSIALLSCCLFMSFPAQAKESRYAQCSRNCAAVMYGKMNRFSTPMGACDYGCQASHWNGNAKGKKMCDEKFRRESLELIQSCRYGADRY